VDPESPSGRAAAPDENLYRQDLAGIRLRDPYSISVERLMQGGYEVKDQPSMVDVERSTAAQLIAFRDVPRAGSRSQAASEMLTVQYRYGRVVFVSLITPMDDAMLAEARKSDAASLPAMQVESLNDRREVRSYGTNRLSGIQLVYWIGTRKSQFHPNERIITLSDRNWCLMEDFRRRR
jgi:hypothetical protein